VYSSTFSILSYLSVPSVFMHTSRKNQHRPPAKAKLCKDAPSSDVEKSSKKSQIQIQKYMTIKILWDFFV